MYVNKKQEALLRTVCITPRCHNARMKGYLLCWKCFHDLPPVSFPACPEAIAIKKATDEARYDKEEPIEYHSQKPKIKRR